MKDDHIPVITPAKADELGVQIITFFKREKAYDLSIFPMKGVVIGTKENPRIIDCPLHKKSRQYNHFEWIENLGREINSKGEDVAYIVRRGKTRALGTRHRNHA